MHYLHNYAKENHFHKTDPVAFTDPVKSKYDNFVQVTKWVEPYVILDTIKRTTTHANILNLYFWYDKGFVKVEVSMVTYW